MFALTPFNLSAGIIISVVILAAVLAKFCCKPTEPAQTHPLNSYAASKVVAFESAEGSSSVNPLFNCPDDDDDDFHCGEVEAGCSAKRAHV